MKKCPYCSEEIQDDAVKCRFCGEWLKEKSKSDSLSQHKSLDEAREPCPECGAEIEKIDDEKWICTKCKIRLEGYCPECGNKVKKINDENGICTKCGTTLSPTSDKSCQMVDNKQTKSNNTAKINSHPILGRLAGLIWLPIAIVGAIFMTIFGLILCATIIGAIFGIPLILMGLTLVGDALAFLLNGYPTVACPYCGTTRYIGNEKPMQMQCHACEQSFYISKS